MSTAAAQFIGCYRLLYQLRQGRTSQVWAAIDDARAKRYAVKFLLPDLRNDREQRAALEHECLIGQSLDHPRVLGAKHFGDSRHGPFLLMELCEGLNLRDVVRKDRFALQPWLTSVVVQATEAVCYLHSQNWLHLDLKPDNFLLTPEGRVRLIDFGLSLRTPNMWERWFWKNRHKAIQGTRGYLSPEQTRLEPVDRRSDIYSLGCAFYHLATGVAPFTASTSNELLTKHLLHPIPNAEADNPNLTPAFANLLRRMMAKMPGERPASADDVLQQLRSIKLLKSEPAAASPTS